jgi:hypothetical protein
VARCTSTGDSEESTIDMSPTVLRRVLPYMAHLLLCPRAEVVVNRGASPSEESDLPLDCHPALERAKSQSPNQSSVKPGTDTDDAPAHRSVSTHQQVLLGCLRTEILLPPRSFATTSDCSRKRLFSVAFRRRRRRCMEPSSRPKPASAQRLEQMPKHLFASLRPLPIAETTA